VGRAPKSTGAAVAAVTSASATAMDWSENCIGVLLISNVAGNQGEIPTERSIFTVVPFYTRTKAQHENIFFSSFQAWFLHVKCHWPVHA